MKRTAIIAAMLLLGAARAGAQMNSCLEPALLYPEFPPRWYSNPDSVMVDTCIAAPPFSPVLYCNKDWSVQFEYSVIHLDSMPPDSIVPGGWQAIDTMYPQTRAAFRALDSLYGGLSLKAFSDPARDTNFLITKLYSLSLGSFQPVDSITAFLGSTPNVLSAYFEGGPYCLCAWTTNEPDSCLTLWQNLNPLPVLPPSDSGPAILVNPDSVMLDTCKGSPTYGEEYGFRWWKIQFVYDVLDLPAAPYDTILERSWTAIDSSYPALRTAFAALESKYGTLTLRKSYPEFADSTNPYGYSKVFEMRFSNYVCIDSVLANLGSLPDVDTMFGERQISFENYPEIIIFDSANTQPSSSVALTPHKSVATLWPNPATNDVHLDIDNAADVWISDAVGRVVRKIYLTPGSSTIDISGLPPGIYLVSIPSLLQTYKLRVSR